MSRAVKEWLVTIHWDATHTSPAIGPFGSTEADREMREIRRAYRAAGIKPPKMVKSLLRPADYLHFWALSHLEWAQAEKGGES